jgi:hypothetical protein
MAFHRFVRSLLAVISFAAVASAAGEKTPPALTQKEIADGWILLFDGESTFGWAGKAEAKGGVLHVAKGEKLDFAVPLPLGEVRCEVVGCRVDAGTRPTRPVDDSSHRLSAFVDVPADRGFNAVTASRTRTGNKLAMHVQNTSEKGSAVSKVEISGPDLPDGWLVRMEGLADDARVKAVKFRPANPEPLFNGKDLTGWKVFKDEKRAKSLFAVTTAGELSVKNGPGDLQTEKQFDNFLLQLECKTNGTALNSGVFFRCIADQYQNGYEMQIQNAYKEGDRAKPADFGTGAIYRRIPARKVVSDDNAWFAMTLLAHGPTIATWVNGYPVVSWKDERAPNDNPRQGLKTGKGHLSIQGHDPTTDLLFRNIRVEEMK